MDRIQRAIAKYDKIASSYARKADVFDSAVEEVRKFIGILKKGSRVLDVGCAAGRDCKVFKGAGFSVVGIDLSEKLLAIAKKKHPGISFRLADMRNLPFRENIFDGVFARAVLHHLEREEMMGVLKQFYNVLKPGGILFIMTKAGSGLLKKEEDLTSGEEREFTLLTKNQLHRFLSKVGFQKRKLYIWNEKERIKGGRDLFWISAYYQK